MDLKEAIKQRRSIRRYKNKEIPMHVLGEIIENARLAPSSGNLQNWRFVIVTDVKQKKEISEASLKQNWMTEAPVFIVICNRYEKAKKLYGKLGKMFSIQNCSIVATYLMLLAKEKGLDTCWIGAFDNEALQRILELPENIDPEIILTLGYSNEDKLNKSQRAEIKDLVYFKKWGNKISNFSKKGIKDKVKELLKR